ncbi:DoxX family membrane protein [Halorubrum sp. CSM-61]|uniref:DoxX family protein n=1 Tax=Halorubrum sp. CSM-61 TaxID=2485838 RepID=UPI000F4BCEE2|nr:DoxX family membrane protein [Halorubrum sp. CSM-61]
MSDETESDGDPVGPLAGRKRPLRYAMSAAYVIAGIAHFLAPKAFARVVPPGLPRPRALVYLSGIAEVGLGLGVACDRTRRGSAWGIMALLGAVFPANVYMATDGVAAELAPDRLSGVARAAAWARLPLQGVLLLWAWWYTCPESEFGSGSDDAQTG